MLGFIQQPPTDEAKIGGVLFVFTGVGAVASVAAAELPGNRTGVRPGGDALPESAYTSPKNRAKYAIARGFIFSINHAHPVAMAMGARPIGQCNRIRSIPLHW